MNIGIIAEWIKLDPIKYMLMATILLGIMKIFKRLVTRE